MTRRLTASTGALLSVLACAGCPRSRSEAPRTDAAPVDTGQAAPVASRAVAEAPPPAPPPWAGRYASPKLRLLLREEDGGLRGTIEKAGRRFELIIDEVGPERLRGSFGTEGQRFAVRLTRNGPDAIDLATGSTTYELKRVVVSNPLDVMTY
ncbi:MAG: hypothetical protein D6731_04405, partial [Planctomycetota bacterium]